MGEQAEGEFNKKFRKSDRFKQDLPEEKLQAFSKILGKFFESEAEDYKKEQEIKSPPDYEALQRKTAKGNMDFSLKSAIIEINRDADRRYQFATMKIRTQERQGKKFPQSSPLLEKWGIVNNNTEAHEKVKATFEFMKVVAEEPDCPPEAKKYIEEWLKEGEEQAQKWADENLKKLEADVMKRIIDNYVAARDEVQQDADNLKKWFRSQKEMPGKTKADVLKDLWAELPKYSEKPVPPLDEEMLAELALEPATEPGEFRHSWGIADKLYKSEAIDAFGARYLLGIYETKDEASKAFDDWNEEYEKARLVSVEEMKQWSKQEQARLDRDVEGQERIKKVLEEARR